MLIRLYSLVSVFVLLLSACVSNKKASEEPVRIPTKEEVGALCLPEEIAPVEAPFPMPQFTKPSFPDLRISILEAGAKEGVLSTQAIQAAIDSVHVRGGGTVLVPAGHWLTGRISLKSGVNFCVEEGATLEFSGDVADYLPVVFTRNEGIEVMSLGALIYANGQDRIAVTGKGKLVGPPRDSEVIRKVMESDVIEKVVSYKTPVEERIYDGKTGKGEVFLPMFISPMQCTNVYIEGVNLSRTAFWNIVPVYCDTVVIRGVTVQSVGIPRGDGIDIESSRNVLIEYSTLSCGDDCFTMKAGRAEDGIRVNKPTENVVVRYCLAQKGHGALTCGSETAGMIRNLYVHDCVFDGTGSGLRFKTRRNRGGGGENLHYERIRMDLSGTAFRWDMLGSPAHMGELADRLPLRDMTLLTPAFRSIRINDVIVEQTKRFVQVEGIPESPLTDVSLENIEVRQTKGLIRMQDVSGFSFRNVRVNSPDDNTLYVLDGRDISLENTVFEVPGDSLNTIVEGASTELKVKN